MPLNGHSIGYDIDSLRPRLEALNQAIDGEVIVRGSPVYGQLPKPFNARFDDMTPLAVARCASAADVVATISASAMSLGEPYGCGETEMARAGLK